MRNVLQAQLNRHTRFIQFLLRTDTRNFDKLGMQQWYWQRLYFHKYRRIFHLIGGPKTVFKTQTQEKVRDSVLISDAKSDFIFRIASRQIN